MHLKWERGPKAPYFFAAKSAELIVWNLPRGMGTLSGVIFHSLHCPSQVM